MKSTGLLIFLILVFTSVAVSEEVGPWTYEISRDGIYVPKLWVDKERPKEAICDLYEIAISLVSFNSGCDLVIQLRAQTLEDKIEGNKGAIFLVVPEGLRPITGKVQMQYLDYNDFDPLQGPVSVKPIEGASLPHFEELLLDILKMAAPYNIGSITEKVFGMIGVGKLEQTDTSGTVFRSASGHKPLITKWNPVYQGGKWVNAGILQFTVPLEQRTSAARSLIDQQGVGAFFFTKFSCASANVGIMIDDMRFCAELEPGEVVKRFIKACVNRDIEEMKKYIDTGMLIATGLGADKETKELEMIVEQVAAGPMENEGLKSIEMLKEKVDDTEAYVWFAVHYRNGGIHRDELLLARTGREWKVAYFPY